MDYIQLYADVEGDDADVSSDDDQQSYNQDEVNFITPPPLLREKQKKRKNWTFHLTKFRF